MSELAEHMLSQEAAGWVQAGIVGSWSAGKAELPSGMRLDKCLDFDTEANYRFEPPVGWLPSSAGVGLSVEPDAVEKRRFGKSPHDRVRWGTVPYWAPG